jgi:hypothetical protein
LPLVPGHDVDLVDLDLACQPHGRGFGNQSTAQLLGHGLHIRPVEAQFLGNLPDREVQPHEVQAQHPHPQRLVMAGQHRAGEVVKAPRAPLAAVALPVRLAIVAPVADHRGGVAPGATHAFWPAVLAHEGEALGVVHQAGQVDQTGGSIGCSHDQWSSSGS